MSKFKLGDRVVFRADSVFVGDPENPEPGTKGFVTDMDTMFLDVVVTWDNGMINTYRNKCLDRSEEDV